VFAQYGGTLILCLLIPVPMLAFAMTESFGTINPGFIIQSFFRSPSKFLTSGIVLFGIFTLDDFFVKMIQGSSDLGIVIKILASAFFYTVTYCLVNSWACSLGMIYYFDKKSLKWNL